jgi:hypothetical protein
MTTRENLLKLTGRRYRPVDIPGIGALKVRSLTELERAKVENAALGDKTILKRVILIQSLVDGATLEPVFSESDFDTLGQLDGAVVDTIVGEAMKLNQISAEDVAGLLGKPDGI